MSEKGGIGRAVAAAAKYDAEIKRTLPSAYQIGDIVYFCATGEKIPAVVTKVCFTYRKVIYSLKILTTGAEIGNVYSHRVCGINDNEELKRILAEFGDIYKEILNMLDRGKYDCL